MFGTPLSNDGRGPQGAQPAFFRHPDREGRRKNSAGSKIPDDLPPGGAVYSVMHVIRMARGFTEGGDRQVAQGRLIFSRAFPKWWS
jgi:hypothetical protein